MILRRRTYSLNELKPNVPSHESSFCSADVCTFLEHSKIYCKFQIVYEVRNDMLSKITARITPLHALFVRLAMNFVISMIYQELHADAVARVTGC